uniref:Uncharacterized protein n=1 Tax=Opuntia streptacantha TaxID=393608 RepID=A0A7C8ZND9_OPUST
MHPSWAPWLPWNPGFPILIPILNVHFTLSTASIGNHTSTKTNTTAAAAIGRRGNFVIRVTGAEGIKTNEPKPKTPGNDPVEESEEPEEPRQANKGDTDDGVPRGRGGGLILGHVQHQEDGTRDGADKEEK